MVSLLISFVALLALRKVDEKIIAEFHERVLTEGSSVGMEYAPEEPADCRLIRAALRQELQPQKAPGPYCVEKKRLSTVQTKKKENLRGRHHDTVPRSFERMEGRLVVLELGGKVNLLIHLVLLGGYRFKRVS